MCGGPKRCGRSCGAMPSREGTTLKALIEEGLQLVLRARSNKPRSLEPIEPFDGDGLTAEFQDAGWERLRDEIYRGRG